MWYYGVFGKQRDESGCGKDICTYAKQRIDKFHQCCSAGWSDGAYVVWHSYGEVDLTMQYLFLF